MAKLTFQTDICKGTGFLPAIAPGSTVPCPTLTKAVLPTRGALSGYILTVWKLPFIMITTFQERIPIYSTPEAFCPLRTLLISFICVSKPKVL